MHILKQNLLKHIEILIILSNSNHSMKKKMQILHENQQYAGNFFYYILNELNISTSHREKKILDLLSEG